MAPRSAYVGPLSRVPSPIVPFPWPLLGPFSRLPSSHNCRPHTAAEVECSCRGKPVKLVVRGKRRVFLPREARKTRRLPLTMAPSADSLDPFHAASGDLVGDVRSIFLRLKDFGWCLGKLVDRVPNRPCAQAR